MAPEAPMQLLSTDRSDVVIVKRGTPGDELWAVHNFNNRRLSFPLSRMLQIPASSGGDIWSDVLNGTQIQGPYLELGPFAVHWLELS